MRVGVVPMICGVLAAASAASACTSWVIRPEAAASGMMTIQKVLDNPYSPLDADFRVAPNGWRWLRIGRCEGPSMAMNEKGVVLTTNTGDYNLVGKRDEERLWFNSFGLQWQVIKNCASAEEGVEALKNLGNNRLFNYNYGSSKMGVNLLIADAKRAFAVQIGEGYCEAVEVTGGMHVVANAWRLPGGETVSTGRLYDIRGNRARDVCAVQGLQKTRENGKYTLLGCFATSRMIRGKKFVTRHPFVPGNRKARNMSLLSGCCEIDAEFPAYLSCAYTSLGPQRHTVYLPIPMAVTQLPDKMRDGRWAQMAFDHQEAFGPEHGDMQKITELEDKQLKEFYAVRDEARKLLRSGRKAEAVKLLNDTFAKQYAEADSLMTELQKAAREKSAEAVKADTEK